MGDQGKDAFGGHSHKQQEALGHLTQRLRRSKCVLCGFVGEEEGR